MKKTKAVLALVIAATLCGCSSKEESSSLSSIEESTSSSSSSTQSSSSKESSSSSTAVSSSSAESFSESKPEESEPITNETFLKGLAGDTILRTDIKQVFVPEGGDTRVEKLNEENFSSVLCMGFIYTAEPNGIFRTNLENADVYDDFSMSFTDVSGISDTDYIRLNVGEKLCGMTLTYAETNFARSEEQTNAGSYFCYGSCEFSGEKTLTGYINLRGEGGSNFSKEGDVMFIPTECELPVVSYSLDSEKGICRKLINGADQNLVWSNEYGSIFLGNIYDNAGLSDFGIPAINEYLKCRIVIDNVKYMASTQYYPRIEAKLVSIELL